MNSFTLIAFSGWSPFLEFVNYPNDIKTENMKKKKTKLLGFFWMDVVTV